MRIFAVTLAAFVVAMFILQTVNLLPVFTDEAQSAYVPPLLGALIAFAAGLIIASLPPVHERIAPFVALLLGKKDKKEKTGGESAAALRAAPTPSIVEEETDHGRHEAQPSADNAPSPVRPREKSIKDVPVENLAIGVVHALSDGVGAVANAGASVAKPVVNAAADGCKGAFSGAKVTLKALLH